MGMDTEEMYRRGVADAAQGEPHPFYYQHYYQYRKGYDRARRSRGLAGGYQTLYRQRRVWLLVAAGVMLVSGVIFFSMRLRSPATTAPTSMPASALVVATRPPTRTPIFPTPTLEPTATPVVLQIGASAQIVNTEGTLRGRKQPKLKAAAIAAFKAGERVRILEGPVEADGFTWWKIEGKSGTGWSAQKSKEGVVWLQPVAEQ
jgi:Bacterial SH3 domain